MTWLYDITFGLYALLMLPFYLAKGKHKEGWEERWGNIPEDVLGRLRGKPVFWVHGVSVGEARLAAHLVRSIRHRIPGMAVLVTATTASGRKVARENLAPEDEALYFPFDFGFVTKRFLNAVKPRVAVFIETEIWPNMLTELRRRGIPSVIVNGRISNDALPRYRWIARALAPALRRITLCLAQSDDHRRRFLDLGMDPQNVRTVGNMKFDLDAGRSEERAELAAVFSRLKSAPAAKVFFCCSTHPGEEEQLLTAYARLKGLYPSLKLVLAPRHIERIASIEALVARRSLSVARLSRALASSGEFMDEILLVDVWGILKDIYRYADLVFMGGSLVPRGGHNIAEPAFAGKPIIHGPHMHNFRDMADEFRRLQAAAAVRDEEELEREAMRLLGDAAACEKLSRNAREVVMKNQGATQKYVEEVLQCMARHGMADLAATARVEKQ